MFGEVKDPQTDLSNGGWEEVTGSYSILSVHLLTHRALRTEMLSHVPKPLINREFLVLLVFNKE